SPLRSTSSVSTKTATSERAGSRRRAQALGTNQLHEIAREDRRGIATVLSRPRSVLDRYLSNFAYPPCRRGRRLARRALDRDAERVAMRKEGRVGSEHARDHVDERTPLPRVTDVCRQFGELPQQGESRSMG